MEDLPLSEEWAQGRVQLEEELWLVCLKKRLLNTKLKRKPDMKAFIDFCIAPLLWLLYLFLSTQLISACICQFSSLRHLFFTGQKSLPSCLRRGQTQLHSNDWRDALCPHCV